MFFFSDDDASRPAAGVLRRNLPPTRAFTGTFVGDQWRLGEHGDQAHWRCLVFGGSRERHGQPIKCRAAPRWYQEGYRHVSWIKKVVTICGCSFVSICTGVIVVQCRAAQLKKSSGER